MKYYVTSDTHFFHKNIIKYCNRPFKDINHMNEILIKNWNSRVKPEDTVFHLGDFGYTTTKDKLLNLYYRLNGKKILLKGNHDPTGVLKPLIDSLSLYYKRKHLLLVHRPEDASIGYDLVLCGHVHTLWKFNTIECLGYKIDLCNVGIDQWNFFPVTINEVLREYERWKREGKVIESKTKISN